MQKLSTMAKSAHVELILLCATFCGTHSANILLAVTEPHLTSQYILFHSIAPGLIQNGHHVYSLIHSRTSFPNQARKVDIIPILYGTEEFHSFKSSIDRQLFNMAFGNLSVFAVFSNLTKANLEGCQNIVDNRTLMEELRQVRVDLVIYDAGGSMPCGSLISAVLKVPYIGISSYYMWWFVRNPALPSFDMMHLARPTKRSLVSLNG